MPNEFRVTLSETELPVISQKDILLKFYTGLYLPYQRRHTKMYKRPVEQGGHAFLPLAWFRPPIHVRACQINAWPILRGCLLARRIDGIGFEQALQKRSRRPPPGLTTRFTSLTGLLSLIFPTSQIKIFFLCFISEVVYANKTKRIYVSAH